MGRWAARAAAVAAGCLAGMVALAGTAFAHVEVTSDPPVEGATNAVVTFTAEAESPTSGVVSVRIVLPSGITPNDVSLNKAPAGWALTPAADGYTVAGPALPQGQHAVHSIIVTHLPDMASLTFKAVVTYADGSVDRWIDDKTAANPDPPHPAPVLQLSAKGGASATPAPTAAAPATVTASSSAASGSGPGSAVWWIVGGLVLVAVVVAVVLARRRRRESAT